MYQTATIPPTPTPPTAQGGDFGAAIRQSVNDAVAGALAPARAEIQEQIAIKQARRDALQTVIERTTSRPGRLELQAQVARLDKDIADLQRAEEQLNAKLGTRDGPRIASTRPSLPDRFDRMDNFNPAPMVIAIVGILFIGFPLAITFARLMWRRASNAPAPLNVETARRFDRLEQSVDSIAIEVERISENQRYLTRLLAEPRKQEIGSNP
jgi:hypothetical protein